MPVEFSQAGRSAREKIETPAVPLDGIRHRAAAAGRRQRVGIASILAALVFAGVSVGTGAAQRAYQGIRIWISGSRAAIEVDSLAVVRDPMASDVRRVADSAAFPVIFPSGIPAGTRIVRIMYSPADRPTTITIGYAPPHGRQFGVTLVQTSSIADGLPPGAKGGSITDVQAGEESVIVPKAYPVPSFVTWNQTPAQSERSTEAFAAPIHIMEPHPAVIVAAERIAGRNPNAVIIGRQYSTLIPELARHHRPLFESRAGLISNIPNPHGEPDYAHGTVQWPKTIVVDASGVAALNAELQRHPCTCPMLIVPSRSGYRITQFDLNGNVLH